MYLFVVEQVTDRTALCHLLNGTCVVPANCAVLGLTLGYDYGRGRSSDLGKYFSCDDASTVCCYPFLVTSLSSVYTRHLGYHDDQSPQLEGFETVYEYWYPNRRQRQVASLIALKFFYYHYTCVVRVRLSVSPFLLSTS